MSETLQEAVDETDSIVARNLAAFREHAPRMHAMLTAIEAPYSQIVIDDAGGIDIAMRGKPFYGCDAVAYTQQQLDSYFARPVRHFIGTPKPEMIPGLAGRFCVALNEAMAEQGIEFVETRAAEDCWYAIVFGIGLGLHLQPVAERTDCRCLILVEPMVENIYHSLSVIDWQEVFVAADGKRRTVHFVTDTNQATIASALRTVVKEDGATRLDGMYVYRHHSLSTLVQAEEALHRDIYLHLVGLGFFEDELVMTANSVANLAPRDVQVLTRPVPVHDTPVILCGSGPSIDGSFEQIRELSDRAIVVSLGSSLRSLLSHGIRPDFHIEMENEPDNARNIIRTDDEFGVGGITLVASTTVQPSGAERFDDTILYFRDRVTSSHLFGRGIEWLGSCGPTVTNAGLIALMYLGFRNFHLFGIDMGSRDVDRYHASDTFIGMGQAREWGSGTRIPVVANFGGQAFAEGVLRWSRLALETVIRLHSDVHVINCSDGARIEGALPMLPHILDIDGPQIDRERLRAMLDEHLGLFDAARRRNAWDRQVEEAALDDIVARIGSILDDAEAQTEPPIDWLTDLYRTVAYDSGSPAGAAFFYGSLTLVDGAIWWYDRRIDDPEARARYRRLAIAQLRKMVAEGRQRLTTLFDDVEAVFAGRKDRVEAESIVAPATSAPGETAGLGD